MRRAPTSLLAGALAFAAMAATGACGPAPAPGEAKHPEPAGSQAAPASTGSAPSITPTPSASGTAATTAPAAPSVPMKPIARSAMEAKLRDIGVDPAALPPLNKLDPKTLRDVMNTFTKALGVGCGYCHEKDFKAPTAKKKIAAHMWNDFTRSLTLEGGGALYCDSCHAGRPQVLDRRDLGALGTWMQDNYVDKVKRADGKEHICDTCHGDPFEGKILSKLWR